jgi:hypothetical protein
MENENISFVELYNSDYSKKIKIVINDNKFNDGSVLSKLLKFDDKFFKDNIQKYDNGIIIRSLIDYNININHWTTYIKAKEIGVQNIENSDINILYEFLAITGGSNNLWIQLENKIINNKKRHFYNKLEINLNPNCSINDKYNIYKKWKYFHRGAREINDDNWVKGTFRNEIGFICGLKYTNTEFQENIERIKEKIINDLKINEITISLNKKLYLPTYQYEIKL